MDSVCVFCGSRPGAGEGYLGAARDLGATLARRGITLVFGGSRLGLMGSVATAALDAGGEVIGVIPDSLLKREAAFDRLTELRVVGSMHERKALMSELAQAFVALPGGFGTFDELFEAVTWAQIGLHDKPVGLLNARGYFDKLVDFIQYAVKEQFVGPADGRLIAVEDDAPRLLDRLARQCADKRALRR